MDMWGNKSSPMVSIIVPVFNGERYLRESLDSIVNQTWSSVEILVMDDASTDSTPEIIAGYGDKVKHIRQTTNKGIYDNANDGIALAKGKYIAVFHSDDVYDPHIVEQEVEYLENHADVGAVFCKDIFVDAENKEYGRLELQPEVSGGSPLSYKAVLNALLKHKNRMFVCPTVMARAAVYQEVGMYRQDKFFNTADLDMWLRIAQKHRLAILENYLIRYRHFAGQSSRRYHKLRTDVERFFTIMDLYLENGGREIATPSALAAYEGHRVQDFLMIAVNHYILDQLTDAKRILKQIRLINLLKGHRIQRGRMLVLYLMLYVIVRVPRLKIISNIFYRRWHDRDKTEIGMRTRGVAAPL